MKKSFYYLVALTIFFVSLVGNNISIAEASESSNASNDLVAIDTSIVPDSYELEVLVNKNDQNNEDMIIFVDDLKYKIVDGKLVEDSTPTFSTFATDMKTITLSNGSSSSWKKYASSGTTVHTGSTGTEELREHTIKNSNGTILSSVKSSAASIGCQKTVTSSGYYTFTIKNLSATTQTWSWTVTF